MGRNREAIIPVMCSVGGWSQGRVQPWLKAGGWGGWTENTGVVICQLNMLLAAKGQVLF